MARRLLASFLPFVSCALAAAACAGPKEPAAFPEDANLPPAVLDNAVRGACDLVFAVAANTAGVTVESDTGWFRDEALAGPAFGCSVSIHGSFARVTEKGGDAVSRLYTGFGLRHWEELAGYAADDATSGRRFAFRKEDVGCLFAAVWQGARPSDDGSSRSRSTADSYEVAAVCSHSIGEAATAR